MPPQSPKRFYGPLGPPWEINSVMAFYCVIGLKGLLEYHKAQNSPPAARGSDFGCGKYRGNVGKTAGSDFRTHMRAARRRRPPARQPAGRPAEILTFFWFFQ